MRSIGGLRAGLIVPGSRLGGAVIAALLICVPVAVKAQAQSASAFVAGVGRTVVEELPARGLDREAARAEFRTLLRAKFDVPGIGRRVVSGDDWNRATPALRSEALTLYETWVTGGLLNLLSRHRGETFRVLKARPAPQAKGGVMIVSSEIRRPNNERVRVDWFVRPAGSGSWLIINLSTAEGNLVENHRAEFRTILEQAPAGAKSTGLEYIVEELRIRTAPLD